MDTRMSGLGVPIASPTAPPPAASTAQLTFTDALVSVVVLPDGYGLLPITLGVAQVCSWTGLKKTKVQELINTGAITTAKVDGRTLCLTSSVVALIERNQVKRIS